MARWIDTNRAFNRAVRDQAAALAAAYGVEGAHAEAQRLCRTARCEEARLFAYNVEVLTAEAAGISLDRPAARALGPEAPLWALPFLSANTLARLRAGLEWALEHLRVGAAPVIGPVLGAYVESRRDRPLTLGLTPRQLECLRWAAEGKSSTDIATIVGVSAKTVDFHLERACTRLGVRTRAQAITAAATAGLLGEPRKLPR